jgi:glycosyltransferase involved in cell wall biosynthesis
MISSPLAQTSPQPQPIAAKQLTSSPPSELSVLQLGMGWFPERFGGLNRVYYDCIQNLPNAGINLQGLVAGSDQVSVTSSGKVITFAQPQSSLLNRWRGIRKAYRHMHTTQHYDVVAAHFALYTFPILDQLKHTPVVTHFHGPWALEGSIETSSKLSYLAKLILEKLTYAKADQFIVLSQAFRQILHHQYGVPLEKIHIVPSGIDLDRFQVSYSKITARQQLGWPTDRPIILAVRRLVKRMGLENLITAMQIVRQQHPDALLLIAGRGDQAQALQEQIRSLDLCEHVKLLGFLADQDLPIAYRSANFSIVPTIAYEGFGLIIPECLATGTPVLGTPVDAIPEILAPLSSDLVLAGSSSQHLATGIHEALSGDRKLPDTETNRTYVEQNYAWPTIAQKMKAVYQLACSH